MHRIDHASATEDNKFTKGDPAQAIPATTVTADIMNALQEEICSVIEGASIALNKNANNQLLAAINTLIDRAAPAGVVFDYAGGTVPDGFLLCDGSPVSRTTYARLFTAIGTTHGVGDGSTTFNLPDSRGRTHIGDGTGTGLTARTLGQQVGAETHQLTINEMPAHNHDLKMSPNTIQSGANTQAPGVAGTGNANFIENKGGGQAHNNMQPSLVVKKMIRY